MRNADIRERLNQGVLDLVKRGQESWKGRREEMSIEKNYESVCCRDEGEEAKRKTTLKMD